MVHTISTCEFSSTWTDFSFKMLTFGATAEKGRGRESRKWLISRICEILCWCLTVDVEKHPLAHSWRNVVFRNAEIRSQVSSINTRKVHQLAFKRIALLDPSVSLGDYRTAVVSPPRYPYEAGESKESDRFDLRAPDERRGGTYVDADCRWRHRRARRSGPRSRWCLWKTRNRGCPGALEWNSMKFIVQRDVLLRAVTALYVQWTSMHPICFFNGVVLIWHLRPIKANS